MRPPSLTDAAVAHLDGRPLVVRASPRHGCCGGHAAIPVAEVGPPEDPARYQRVEDGPVLCFVDPDLGVDPGVWTVDAAGIGRWRRLQILGAEGLDPGYADG
jgi:hypothetical protein